MGVDFYPIIIYPTSIIIWTTRVFFKLESVTLSREKNSKISHNISISPAIVRSDKGKLFSLIETRSNLEKSCKTDFKSFREIPISVYMKWLLAKRNHLIDKKDLIKCQKELIYFNWQKKSPNWQKDLIQLAKKPLPILKTYIKKKTS
jgi:hypothetical protein